MRATVAIIRCPSYQPAEVEAALQRALDLIGGLAQFIKPGARVLLKVNAVMGKEPASAVCTHPAIIAAVIKAVKSCGGIALVGDSPGDVAGNVRRTMELSGIRAATEAAGGSMLYFEDGNMVELESPSHSQNIPKIKIARCVMETDLIINLPKIKTHNLTLYTGAIKNMFGSLLGFEKGHCHLKTIRPKEFSEVLVDIFQLTKPTINIMDAVVGMEGNGPAGGNPRLLGAIIVSTDAVAMDSIGAYLLGFNPQSILTTAIAAKRKMGQASLKEITILGDPLSTLRQSDWKKPFNLHYLTGWMPAFIFNWLKPLANQVRISPEIDQAICTRCQVCVKNCPAKTIFYNQAANRVIIDLKNCISCYCCHELCSYRAINLKRSWLTRLLGIGNQ